MFPLARNQLRYPKQRYSTSALILVEVEHGVPCKTCGETAITCVRELRSGRMECLNCRKKRTQHARSTQKTWIREHKQTSGCTTCGEDDPACLEYHHVHPKKKKFSIGSVPVHTPKHVILREIEKCVVVCANCHTQLHTHESV